MVRIDKTSVPKVLAGLVVLVALASGGRLEVPADPGGPSAPPPATRAPVEGVAVAPLPPSPRPDPAWPATAPPPDRAAAPPPVPGEQTVTAAAGDTIHGLSRRHGVPARSIIAANALQPPYELIEGQRLRLPQSREHEVLQGETLFSIARQHNVDLEALAAANGMVAPYRVRVGQRLTLPNGAPDGAADGSVDGSAIGSGTAPTPVPAPAAAQVPVPSADPAPELAQRQAPPPVQPAAPPPQSATPNPTTQAPAANTGPLASPPPRADGKFAWPVQGRVISAFGAKSDGLQNDGINIAAARGTPVLASENGVVAYAGNELRGFGNLVLIRHADDWITAYAHADRLAVRRGDVVNRGQVIAYVGSTGNVSEAQLHFQIRRGKQAVDPRQHLARGT